MGTGNPLHLWLFILFLVITVMGLLTYAILLSKKNTAVAKQDLEKISKDNKGKLEVGESIFETSIEFPFGNNYVSIKFTQGFKRKYHTEILTIFEVRNKDGKLKRKTFKGLSCIGPESIYSEIEKIAIS